MIDSRHTPLAEVPWKEKGPAKLAAGRVCEDCGKRLNRYHKDTVCYACADKRIKAEIEAAHEMAAARRAMHERG